jgi:hypothetical protein
MIQIPEEEYEQLKRRAEAYDRLQQSKTATPAPMRGDALTHKEDGTPRHMATVAVLRHFRFGHLPEQLREFSRPCCELAVLMANVLPEGPDLTCGLRDLLAAKDNFVRARV